MSPFTPDGRLSASALRQLARHAGGALGELPSGGLSTYASDTSVIPVSVTPDLPAWVKVTSATAQTVTFTGGTVQAYPGLLTAFQTVSPAGWADTTTVVWLYPANGEVPVLNDRYPCLLLGTDTSGEQVWGTVPPSGTAVNQKYESAGSFGLLTPSASWTTIIAPLTVLATSGTFALWGTMTTSFSTTVLGAASFVEMQLFDTTTAQAVGISAYAANVSVVGVTGFGSASTFGVVTVTGQESFVVQARTQDLHATASIVQSSLLIVGPLLAGI